ncbi:MAG: DUF5696 domain-containing protein, partial [Tenericutes bacterium]|nr:DUF5696 domain-containing protein [Mycoplasmatota bacterium]
MLQIAKKILIVLGLVSTTFVIVETSSPNNEVGLSQNTNLLIDDLIYQSSRYSHPDDLTVVNTDDYINITNKDEEILQNDQFILYLNEDNLGIKVLNKQTNYVWNTALDRAQAGTFTGLLESGIGFEYFNVEQNYNNPKNIGISDTEFRVETTIEDQTINFDVNIDGSCQTRDCNRYYPFYLQGLITLEQMIEEYEYSVLDLGFSFEITLTENGIEFYLPVESIYEGNPEQIQLSSIIVFPGMGATYLDDIPGYMMIPDGIGALIRYEDNEGKFVNPYQSRYFGSDYGVGTNVSSLNQYKLSLPIFGAVHGVNQNAFVGMIESGATIARLFAYPNGATNVNYNLIFNKFDLKQTYTQSFTTDRTGGALRVYESKDEDIRIRYDFLTNDQANYVGMAQAYQGTLAENNTIMPMNPQNTQIPLHLQYLMADSKSRFIGREIIEMTNVNDVNRMYDFFMDNNLTNQRVSLLGWNDGGYSGHLPSDVDFENKLGRNRLFLDLINKIEEKNEILLVNNYVIGSNNTYSLNYGRNVAEAIDRFKLGYSCDSCVYEDTYLLYPEFSYDRAMSDLGDYQDVGADVMFQSLGANLFSYFDDEINTRKSALDIYQSIIEAYQDNAQYVQPNAYAFLGMESYYNMPLYNNQYSYFDDLVPVLPIVMSGYVEMFSSYLNFNSLGKAQLLMLIDFNIYPSYLLTEERPSNLAGTDLESFYTSQFDVWNQTIIEEYEW